MAKAESKTDCQNAHPREALIRIFGGSHKNRKQTIRERRLETETFAILASQTLAPKLYCDFGDGRIEEFVDGKNPSLKMMQDKIFIVKVAKRIARFHKAKGIDFTHQSSFETHVVHFLETICKQNRLFQSESSDFESLEESLSESDRTAESADSNLAGGVSASKVLPRRRFENQRPDGCENKGENNPQDDKAGRVGLKCKKSEKKMKIRETEKIHKSREGVKMAVVEAPANANGHMKSSIQRDIDHYRMRKKIVTAYNMQGCPSFLELERETMWIINECKRMGGVLDFCHNDVQRGNIMVEKGPDGNISSVRLIDFEYASWNYRAYELGNFFCESYIDNFYDGGKCFKIYTQDFPRRRKIMAAVESYLEEVACMLCKDEAKEGLGEDGGAKPREEYENGNCSLAPCSTPRSEAAELYEQIKIGMLCSNFYWAMWALIQDAVTDIDWCYHQYAVERFKEYFRLKELYVRNEWE